MLTGSQLPLALPRSDARQNLLDSVCCATAAFSPPHVHLQEVAVCFGGRLMRGNRSQKVNSSAYQVQRRAPAGCSSHAGLPFQPDVKRCAAPCLHFQAFDSPTYPYLAEMGVDINWDKHALLAVSPSTCCCRARRMHAQRAACHVPTPLPLICSLKVSIGPGSSWTRT